MLPKEGAYSHRFVRPSFRPSFRPSVQSYFSTTLGPNRIKLHILYKLRRTLRLCTSSGFQFDALTWKKGVSSIIPIFTGISFSFSQNFMKLHSNCLLKVSSCAFFLSMQNHFIGKGCLMSLKSLPKIPGFHGRGNEYF